LFYDAKLTHLQIKSAFPEEALVGGWKFRDPACA
jgi:hypothetical protein